MASVIGVDRRQYKLKESGDYPFHDYEILTICNEIDVKPEIFLFNYLYLIMRCKGVSK